MYDEQRAKIIKLLETAQALANDLQEPDVAFLIDRAIDQCRASLSRLAGRLRTLPANSMGNFDDEERSCDCAHARCDGT